ncbi:MAG: AbrB/MazE/SpoVT family DNA-binding domain-containing protein [Spirochaetes bacterium]|nr:AbrB/MazE/SpoVT family DNA-binding domain-containing protein [Spirochaetota bacterium]
MQTTIVKWGNSQGIRIPKVFLSNLQITENDMVEIKLENDKIIIEKSNTKKHKTTKERLADFYGVNSGKKHIQQEELDWGKPAGKEIW